MSRPDVQPDRPASRQFLPWVQALRAFAALSVAFAHISHDAITNGADPDGLLTWIVKFMPWDAGVDIFFVISGFVIIHASAPLFARPGGAGVFIRRRLTRIVPLYWIMTTAFLGTLLLDRSAINGDIGGLAYIAASYLFIPWPRPDGIMQPVFGLGWTLNYEMFFYVIITPFLLLRRGPAVLAVAMLFCAFVMLGETFGFRNPPLGYWSRPLILEFVAGMMIAMLFAQGVRLSVAMRIGLVLLAVIVLHSTVSASPRFRALAYGLPAVALIATAALTSTSAILSRIEAMLVRLGDASYALYLVHPFVMRGFAVLWHRFHVVNEFTGIIYVVVGLVAAQACALGVNSYIERNIYVVLRRRAGVLKNEAV